MTNKLRRMRNSFFYAGTFTTLAVVIFLIAMLSIIEDRGFLLVHILIMFSTSVFAMLNFVEAFKLEDEIVEQLKTGVDKGIDLG